MNDQQSLPASVLQIIFKMTDDEITSALQKGRAASTIPLFQSYTKISILLTWLEIEEIKRGLLADLEVKR